MSAPLEARVTALLRAAQDWRLIGVLFERPRGEWAREVAALAAGCADAELCAAARAAAAATEGDYLAVLGPGAPVSPREAGYRRATDPAQILAQIQAAYDAFAYLPAAEDPPDHVAVEAGFMGWLCLKQAYALAGADEESAAIAAETAQSFARRHLGAAAEALCLQLAAAPAAHLLGAARALHARVGDRPSDLEGDWIPEGLDEAGCAAACAATGGEEEPDDVTRTILAGMPSGPHAS